jgi:hypothetical protein
MNQQRFEFVDSIYPRRTLRVEALVRHVSFAVRTPSSEEDISSFLSYPDARKLVEMLIKHTHPGQKLSLPMPVKTPQLILAWNSLDPLKPGQTFLHVGSEAGATSNAEALKRAYPYTPIWLAQITKQFVQPNPTYEWKDL